MNGPDILLYMRQAGLADWKLDSHFLRLGWMLVARILEIRIGIGTVSNALEMSIAATIARGAGFLLLRPCSIFWDRLVRRVVVECCERKLCCVG